VDQIRHVFQNESQRDVKYVLVCEVPMSERAAFEKILPWLEKNARFSLVVAPCEVQLRLTSDGKVMPSDDSGD
jgi:hypothetical protein